MGNTFWTDSTFVSFCNLSEHEAAFQMRLNYAYTNSWYIKPIRDRRKLGIKYEMNQIKIAHKVNKIERPTI